MTERPKSAPVGEFPVGSLAEWLMCNHWLLGSPGLPGSDLVVRSPISNLEAYAQSRRSQLIVVSCYTRCLALEGMVLFGGDGLPIFGKILVTVFFLVFLTLWSWYYSIIIIIFFVFCCDFSLTINHHHLSWLGFRFPFSTFQTQHESAYVITWVVSSFSRLRFWQPCSWPTRQRGQEEVRIRLDLSWNPCCFEYPKIIKNHKGLFERGRILIILYSISLEIKVHKSMRNHNRLHFILDLSQLCQSWF